MSVVDEIKERADIVEVIGEHVDLKKSGKNYTGFCPFHPNTRTPAFVVFPDTGTWRCFGACNDGGDIFSFLMKREGFDFREALEVLAKRTGVELRPRTPEEEARAEENEHLRELLESAVTFFRHQLLETSAGEEALTYLRGRDLTEETVESFELGYAPDSWEAMVAFMREKGVSDEDLLEAGLVSERESGGIYDRFRHRLMIPIRDHRGRMAGFGARVLDPDDVPKYLNSPQTPVFDKGRLLYGLDKARREIRSAEQAVVVEGYMDVIGLHQAGFENAVSPMGTALSETQLRLLKRFSRKIVLALDADAAGEQATLRGLEVAREAMDRSPDPVFAARGLVRYEGRLDAELRIVTLPEGLDPDEVVVQSEDAWPGLLSGARTVVDYVMEVLSADRDLEDAKNKSEIAKQVLPLIEDVADPVEREAYRQKLARRLKVDERALLEVAKRRRPSRGGPGGRQAGALPATRAVAGDPLERFCLGMLLRRPELLYRLDRELQALELERVGEEDFAGSDRRVIFRAVRTALDQHELEPAEHWREALDDPLVDLAHSLMERVADLDLDRTKVLDEVSGAFLRLRKRLLSLRTSQVQFQQMAVQERAGEELSEEPEVDLEQMKEEVYRLAVQRARLERALSLRSPVVSAVVSEDR